MAWNPSPAVEVARDAAQKLGIIGKNKVTHCIITYITDAEQIGYSSYGSTKAECAEAKGFADAMYAAAIAHAKNNW